METFFFKSSKNGTFWAKLRRVKMAWTFLLNSAQFFRFKNWCKITSRKKSSLTSARSCAEQVVKLPFFSKKCIFRAEKGIFSKSSFYTKMFSDPKYSFSVCQKYFFSVSKKVSIFHRIQPTYFVSLKGAFLSHSAFFFSNSLFEQLFCTFFCTSLY